MVLMQQIDSFIHYLRFEKRYAVPTIKAYHTDLLQAVNYLKVHYEIEDPQGISPFHLRSWLAQRKESGESARTINRKISTLQSFFKQLLKEGVIYKNPAESMHSLRLPERLPSYLRETETVDLFQKPIFTEGFEGHTERLMLELFYQVGLRRNELLTLKEANVEWSLKQLRILGKGNKERLIPIKVELLNLIQMYLQEKSLLPKADSLYLLVLPSGEPLYAMYVYRKVKLFLSQISTLQKRSPHILRHTFATHLLNNGANIQAIKDLLGHSSLAATQIYTHTNIEKLKEIHKLNHPRG